MLRDASPRFWAVRTAEFELVDEAVHEGESCNYQGDFLPRFHLVGDEHYLVRWSDVY